jgi:glycosyltransferase involved in cell wall biosynthesis
VNKDKTQKIEISLIVPVYQAESGLRQCVDSVLKQDFTKFEIILIDDGSTDSSPEICDQYASKDKRVKVIHQKNAGQTKARLAGLKQARGEYVWFVDSDDWLVPGALGEVVASARLNRADIVTFDVFFNYDERKTNVHQSLPGGLFDEERLQNEIYPKMIYSGKFFYFGVFAAMWNKVMKREIALECMKDIDPRVRIGEDGLTTFAAFLQAKRVFVMPKRYFYNYRDNNPSLTRSYVKDQLSSALLLIRSLRNINRQNKVYDLSSQIDYYCMYNMWSICVEEFYYRHKKAFFARVRYINDVMIARETLGSVRKVSYSGLRLDQKLFFWAMKHQVLVVAVLASIYTASYKRLKIFVKRIRKMY